jgi:hypothetical protein
MTPVRASLLMGVISAFFLCGTGMAMAAEDPYDKALRELQIKVPESSMNVTIPSPKSAPAEVVDSTRGDEGAAALRNLKEEESLRIDREIRDMLER